MVNAVTYKLPYDVRTDFEPIALLTDHAAAHHRAQGFSGEGPQGTDRLAQGQSRQGDRRRPSARPAARRSSAIYFQKETGTQLPLRALSRRRRRRCRTWSAGQVDLMFDQAANALAPVRAGTIKAYAVMAKTRWAALPDVPRSTRPGAPGFYVAYWHGLWAPKGTPKDIIAKLNAAVVHALADPAVKQAAFRQSATTSCRATSRRRRRSPPTTRPRSTSGGRSSAPPA